MATKKDEAPSIPINAQPGNFAGVFTPIVLTIPGVILFMHLGFVVGEAGLGRALVIITPANTISILTRLSLASFYSGALGQWNPHQVVLDWSAPVGAQPFGVVFAMFFPAVSETPHAAPNESNRTNEERRRD